MASRQQECLPAGEIPKEYFIKTVALPSNEIFDVGDGVGDWAPLTAGELVPLIVMT